jgi:lipopolysaccharide/colanic/teichoic acid biosynthesis glycosyltransferase
VPSRPGDGRPPPPLAPTPTRPRPSVARRLKHGTDRAVAVVALVVTAPLFLLLAVTLLAVGVRRVLRIETRIGERGPFPLLSLAAPPALEHPWVARALNGTGLATLPQLFNLLRGDLSLVGPRPRYPGEPHPPVRPGMAGLAQAAQAVRMVDRDEVFALDALYAERWSIGLDLRLLAGAVGRLLAPGPLHR